VPQEVSSWSGSAAPQPPPPFPPQPAQPAGPAPSPAGFWIRFLASALDGIILWFGQALLFGLFFSVAALTGSLGQGEPGPGLALLTILVWLVAVAGQWLYFALQESSAAQATLGKRALGLAVATVDGRRIGFGQATGRFFGKILSAIPLNLGFVAAAFTDRKRALHDYVAGTVVERRGQAGAAGIVAAVVGGGFVLIFILGILAAIAIPNFIRFQLRAKEQEARTMLLALSAAQAGLAEQGQGYAELSLPAGQTPGTSRLVWSPEDLEAARTLGWAVDGASYFTYQVAVEEDDEGHTAYAACAEADLDGNGSYAAWAVFQPAMDAAGQPVLEPPEAPCAFGPELARSAVRGPDDPIGHPVKLSPRDVF